MRTGLACLLVIALGNLRVARADDRSEKGSIGLGVMVGEPVAVCGRLYVKDDQAIQAAAGLAFLADGLVLQADYVFHPYILQTRDSFVLATYVGPGARVIRYNAASGDFVAIGARVVGGLLFDFKNPLDAFVEVAGIGEFGFKSGEGFGLAINIAAGVRYYF